jgi:hypothetical protein
MEKRREPEQGNSSRKQEPAFSSLNTTGSSKSQMVKNFKGNYFYVAPESGRGLPDIKNTFLILPEKRYWFVLYSVMF